MSENKQVLTNDEINQIIKNHLIQGEYGDYLENDGFELSRAIEAAVLSASAEAVNKELLVAAIEALSACNSVSRSPDREVKREGCVGYIQTEEWCKWVENDIAKQLHSAINKAEGQS